MNRYLRTWRLPDSPYTADVKVTMRHLLSHQSGIVDPPGSFGIYRAADPLPAVKEILTGATHIMLNTYISKMCREADSLIRMPVTALLNS